MLVDEQLVTLDKTEKENLMEQSNYRGSGDDEI